MSDLAKLKKVCKRYTRACLAYEQDMANGVQPLESEWSIKVDRIEEDLKRYALRVGLNMIDQSQENP